MVLRCGLESMVKMVEGWNMRVETQDMTLRHILYEMQYQIRNKMIGETIVYSNYEQHVFITIESESKRARKIKCDARSWIEFL